MSKKDKKLSLDTIDKRILYELDIQGDRSFDDIGRILKIPKETIAFRVKRLIKNGVIKGFPTTIHVSRLGYYYNKFFLKFQKTTIEKESEIVEYLRHHSSIAYFASLEGRYDVTFLVIAKNVDELQSFLNPFKSKFGEYILDQEILTMTQVHRFNFRFFYSDGTIETDTYPEDLTPTNIDNIDYSIIKSLAKNSRENLSSIARQTKNHVNVVRYRIDKLRKLGILGKPVLDIEFNKFGVEHYQINLLLKNQSFITPIVEMATEIPESTFATVTLGKYDLALEFAVANNSKIKEILNSIKIRYPEAIISSDILVLHEHLVNWFPRNRGNA
jgi:DNA-binding Lrp family transcriptional regulator